ncbi:MAG: MFS transporter [Clostridia bacterium]|nr:MFS transporter [Clostridia bacterium]
MRPVRSYTFRYALIQALYWSNYVTVLGYSSVYLLSCGLTNTMIGILIGISGAAAALIQPLTAGYADKPGSLSVKQIACVMAGAALAAAACLFFVRGSCILLTGFLYAICITLLQALMPFVNSLGTEMIRQGATLNWGTARGTGSFVYAAVSYLAGLIITKAGITCIPPLMMLTYSLLLLSVCIYPFRKGNASADPPGSASPTRLADMSRRYPRFFLMLIGMMLAYISHASVMTYLYQIVASKGGGSAQLGTLMSVMALVELPALFGFRLFLKKAGSDTWLRLCCISITLHALAILIAPNMPFLYCVQLFQAFGWAIIAIAPVYYITQVIPKEDAVKGQAFNTMAYTIGSVLASLAGGGLLDIGGAGVVLIFAILTGTAGSFMVGIYSEKLRTSGR